MTTSWICCRSFSYATESATVKLREEAALNISCMINTFTNHWSYHETVYSTSDSNKARATGTWQVTNLSNRHISHVIPVIPVMSQPPMCNKTIRLLLRPSGSTQHFRMMNPFLNSATLLKSGAWHTHTDTPNVCRIQYPVIINAKIYATNMGSIQLFWLICCNSQNCYYSQISIHL